MTCSATAMPEVPGIRMSRKTRSGLMVSIIRMAVSPSAASWISPIQSTVLRCPRSVRRASGSSSTITTRTSFVIGILADGSRDDERHRESIRLRRDVDVRAAAVDRAQALAQRTQAELRSVLGRHSVAAVIFHLHEQVLLVRARRDLDASSVRTHRNRMPYGVFDKRLQREQRSAARHALGIDFRDDAEAVSVTELL